MRHFITGGSGFVGMHLVDLLLEKGHDITIYDTVEPDAAYRAHPRVRFVKGDVRDLTLLRSAMQGNDVVHHNAAVLPLGATGKELRDVNVGGTRNVLEAARATGIRKVINISSTSIYGIQHGEILDEGAAPAPIDPYGASKAEAEQVCRAFRAEHPSLDISTVRPCPIIGTGRMGIFGILFDWILRGKRVYVIGDGRNPYQFVGVSDLVRLCALLAERPAKNEDFNAGSAGYGTSAEDLEALIRHAKTSARVTLIPAGPARLALRLLDALHVSPLTRYHYMTADKPHRVSVAKAERLLGWVPRETNIDVLMRTYDWYVANRDRLATISLGASPHRKPLKQGILAVLRLFS